MGDDEYEMNARVGTTWDEDKHRLDRDRMLVVTYKYSETSVELIDTHVCSRRYFSKIYF